MHYVSVDKALRRMHMPVGLVRWIRKGVLADKVREAQAQLDALNARLDAWEGANPEAMTKVPWYQAREAWKAAGRPRAHWIEELKWLEAQPVYAPISASEVAKDLLTLNRATLDPRIRARAEARRFAAAARAAASQDQPEDHEAPAR